MSVSERSAESSLGGLRGSMSALEPPYAQWMGTLGSKDKSLFREYAYVKDVGTPNNVDLLVFPSPPTRVEGSQLGGLCE